MQGHHIVEHEIKLQGHHIVEHVNQITGHNIVEHVNQITETFLFVKNVWKWEGGCVNVVW